MHKRKAGLWAEGPMMGSCMPLIFIPVQTEGRPSLAEAEEQLLRPRNKKAKVLMVALATFTTTA